MWRLQFHRISQNKTAQGYCLGPSSFHFFQRELTGIPTAGKCTSESLNRQALDKISTADARRSTQRKNKPQIKDDLCPQQRELFSSVETQIIT